MTHRLFAGMGLFALAGSLLLPAPDAMAQCSTSSWSSTTGTVDASGSGNSADGIQYENQCGLNVLASNAPAYVTTSEPDSETLVSTRFYLYADELDLSGGDAIIYKGRGNGATQYQLALREIGGDLHLVTFYRDNGSLEEHNETVPLKPTWQAITLNWFADGIGGAISLSLDGREQFSVTGIDNGDEFIANLDLGLTNSVSGSGKIVVDAFETRRATPEPPLLATNELSNISTRAAVGAGATAVIGGFVIDGDMKKCVVIRGRGPSVNVNIQRLEDATLTLKAAGNPATIAFNDDWQDDPGAGIIQEQGVAPGDASESAIYTCLEPGAYTAQLRNVGGTDLGLGIVEVFDVDLGTPFLLNISTRAEVKSGAQRVVAGFIIGGDVPRDVLIRGRGPTVNINRPTVADPTLELRDGPSVLASNNNWQNASNSGAISATGIAPTNPLESAILTTLDPGAYTVFLASGTGQPGIGIVEVIDISGGSIGSN